MAATSSRTQVHLLCAESWGVHRSWVSLDQTSTDHGADIDWTYSSKVLCSTGAAARMDPTRIKTADLSATTVDPLARAVRKILRDKYGFPEKRSADFGIPAVYSDEPLIDPVELHYDGGMGFRCVCPHGENGLHECEKRNRIDGTAGFVAGSFGLTCASVVVRALVKDLRPEL